jgi:uncharacterized membrane protein
VSYYEVLLFLHVATAVIWLGSGFFLQMLVLRAEKTGDRLLTKQISGHAGWMAQRIFIPASLAVLVFGILLTIEGPWSFDQLWIVFGLVGYAISFFVGILFIEPEGKRIHTAMEAYGPESPQAGFHVHRINVVSRMELVVLYLVIAVMALKPTGDDTGTLIIMAAVVLATLAAGLPKLRSAPEAPQAPAAAPAD